MAMFLIGGGFRITGAQPDGESIRGSPSITQVCCLSARAAIALCSRSHGGTGT